MDLINFEFQRKTCLDIQTEEAIQACVELIESKCSFYSESGSDGFGSYLELTSAYND